MGGESKADQKTTTQQLTPEQQQLVSMAMPQAEAFAASAPKLPGSGGVAQFDPLQVQGQNQVLGATPTAQGVVGGAANANQWLTSGAALDPTTNPALQSTINAATRPIYENLNDTTLPQLSADASTGAGGMSANVGGSREGIAQGIATRSANNAAGAAASGIANQGYQSGLNALLTATGQAPGTAAAQTIPGTITSTVGDVRQGQNQANLSADASAQQFQDFLPMLKAQFLGQMAAGTPGGTVQSTGTSNTDANPLSQIIGGASAAGGLAGGLSKLLPLFML